MTGATVVYALGVASYGGRLPSAVDADKVCNGAVVGAFGLRWEEAAGQLSHAPVVLYAFAALSLV
jgi:hypothetical protein